MPWKTRDEIPDRLKNAIEPPLMSVGQANAIAEMAEALEREGKVDSPWAVAIAHFKKYHVKSPDGSGWVKRERVQSEADRPTLGRKGGPEAGGPGGTCRCSECEYEVEHKTAESCSEMKCPECGATLARVPEGEAVADERESAPFLALSLPAVERLVSGELDHVVHMGNLEEIALAPVLITHEGRVYAKVVLSRPVPFGSDVYSYDVKVLEVYDPPRYESTATTYIPVVKDTTTPIDEQSFVGKTRLAEAQHSRSKCMGCSKPPVVDVHWADGRGRAWFCLRHFKEWIAEGYKEIVRAWHIVSGEVPVEMGEGKGEQILKLEGRLSQEGILKAITRLEGTQVKEALLDERVSWRLPPFSSEGGNYFLAPTIRDIFPLHNVFVETHSGASNVLFSKSPVSTEVLNDTDVELIQAYESIRALTLTQLIELRNKNWYPWERRFNDLKENEAEGEVDCLYRFFYLSWYSFDSNRKDYRGRPKGWSLEARLGRIENARVRLREVKLTSEDGIACIKRWDGPTTAFFLDPPFPASGGDAAGVLQEVLRSIEGKFVLRISDTQEHRDLLSEYNIMSTSAVKRAGQASSWEDGEIVRARSELLVTNCDVPDGLGASLLGEDTE